MTTQKDTKETARKSTSATDAGAEAEAFAHHMSEALRIARG
jgi:hypothetical protein